MVSVALRPNLWFDWTQIAIQAEARSQHARTLGLAASAEGENFAVFMADETHETMVSVAATRSALSHLEADWKEYGLLDGVSRDRIPVEVTTDLPDDVEKWLAQIKQLIDDRIQLAHLPQPSASPVPHPVYPTNVSGVNAYYVAERASAAIDLLLDFYHRVIDSPSDRIAAWSNKRKHVPAAFEEFRKDAAIDAGQT